MTATDNDTATDSSNSDDMPDSESKADTAEMHARLDECFERLESIIKRNNVTLERIEEGF